MVMEAKTSCLLDPRTRPVVAHARSQARLCNDGPRSGGGEGRAASSSDSNSPRTDIVRDGGERTKREWKERAKAVTNARARHRREWSNNVACPGVRVHPSTDSAGPVGK